jgi:hypothetical protein
VAAKIVAIPKHSTFWALVGPTWVISGTTITTAIVLVFCPMKTIDHVFDVMPLIGLFLLLRSGYNCLNGRKTEEKETSNHSRHFFSDCRRVWLFDL